MAPSFKPWQRMKPARGVPLGGGSSVLRLAARERQASAKSPAWLAGLTRAMRSAGAGAGARALPAVPAGGDFFAPSEWLSAR